MQNGLDNTKGFVDVPSNYKLSGTSEFLQSFCVCCFCPEFPGKEFLETDGLPGFVLQPLPEVQMTLSTFLKPPLPQFSGLQHRDDKPRTTFARI